MESNILIPSGIAPLDQRLGGLLPARTYVLTGTPGTGKTVACLEFVAAALEDGQSAVMLTQDDPTDLLAQAQFLGVDLEPRLAEERLVLLRYQLDFTRRFARAASPEEAFVELKALMGRVSPSRIVIDSVAPLLEAGPASGAGIGALVTFLESLGVTALVTYPADLAGSYDRRLEPLIRRAGAIVHLCANQDHDFRMEIRKMRYAAASTAPIAFRISPGVGIEAVAEVQRRRAGDMTEGDRRRLVVIDPQRTFAEDVLAALRANYQVLVRTTVTSALADLVVGSGAVLLHVRRDTVADALALVRGLRRMGNSAPVILVTPFTLRSDDRARALRAGADDFLTGELHPSEFILRLEGMIQHGHVPRGTGDDVEVPLVTQPSADGERYELLDAHSFRNAVNAHIAGDHVPFFTLVALRPRGSTGLVALAETVLRVVRKESGDLAGLVEGSIAVYLHSARRKDVAPFIERVREECVRAGTGDIDVDVATYPTEEDRVLLLLGGARLPNDERIDGSPPRADDAELAAAEPPVALAGDAEPLVLENR